MSIVIIGGNERMVCKYKSICKNHGCEAKVYAKEKCSMKSKIGCPDRLIIFMNTVSHAMVTTAVCEAKRKNVAITRLQSSSASALDKALKDMKGV